MTKELQHKLERFNKQLEKAKDLRSEIESYLEEKYDIDTQQEYEYLEDSMTWCYGFDASNMEKLIENAKERRKYHERD